jgi:U3 small nucleolar RNA-associated protein 3
VGATKLGQQYLLTKAMIQATTSLNLLMYLLLKSEQQSANSGNAADPALIQNHPVMLHLQKLHSLARKLEEGVERNVDSLPEQLETIVKASELLNAPENAFSEEDSVPEESDDSGVEIEEEGDDVDDSEPSKSIAAMFRDDAVGLESSDSDDDDSSVDEETNRRTALTEARFGLRPIELLSVDQQKQRKKFISSDAGDVELDDVMQLKRAGQSLATTLNSIEQRTAAQRQRQKRPTQQLAEHLDETNDDELRRGLDMMEAELGKVSDDDQEEMDENAIDPELDDEYDNTDDFYNKVSKKSKAAKEEKKRRYIVAPKFPRVEEEIVGERAVGKQIMKNRGLVAHKAKINRNPRVKKREQYRKALRNRKGAVRDVRTGEGHHYEGEQTGIKTSVTRSRKLA